MRKSNTFFEGAQKKQVRTVSNGSFHDQVMGKHVMWSKGEEIKLEEIMILKLYTDYDKLQLSLERACWVVP